MKHARTATLATATIALLALTGCSGPTAPATFTAKGKLRDQTVPRWSAGANCDSGNYGTLGEGTEVKIQSKGATVAMGKLKHGVMAAENTSGYFCDYELSVENVPAGAGFYTVDLGDRLGHKEFAEKDLTNGVTVETSTFDGRKY